MDPNSIPFNFMHMLVVSVSVGALIGLIRQWSDEHEARHSEGSAGLRTYALWSLLGYLSAYIHVERASFFFPVSFATFGLFLIAAGAVEKERHRGLGLTSYAAAILTFLAGALIFWNQIKAAIAVAVTIGILIAAKPVIHKWTRNLTNEDVLSLLQFLAVTGLILPLVPNRGFGPLGAFNPYNIWLMVVLISGLGFAGYLAMRLLGSQSGILITGLAGGLASSTATTLALARNSRDNPAMGQQLAIGIVIANTVMLGRVAVIVLAINQPLFLLLLPPLAIMALPSSLFLALFFLRYNRNQHQVSIPDLRNPLSLKLAIKFALIYAIIVFCIKAVSEWGHGAGFYPVAFLSGLTDMDAIALSLVNAERTGSVAASLAVGGIVTGAIANSIFKTGLGVWLGDKSLRGPLLTGMLPMIAAGAGGLLYLQWV